MSLKPQPVNPIPAQTIRVARAAFPKGNLFMAFRDKLGILCEDEKFVALFPTKGQPALAPWRLCLVTLMQFIENLTDREAAEAVRARLDWKYALSLELEDSGFDFSVLSEFRSRLVDGQAEHLIFDTILTSFKESGLVKAGGIIRSDSTHILGAVRRLNRVMLVGETMRATLNSLALVAPKWLSSFAPSSWHTRYDHRIEEYRLPRKEAERVALAQTYGADGHFLLMAIFTTPELVWLAKVEAVQLLRRVWLQQYEFIQPEGVLRFRINDNIAPPAKLISSPYDSEVTLGHKNSTLWTGYKVHLTESCEANQPHLITAVQTSRAGNGDVDITPVIHQDLAKRDLLPKIHLADTGYSEGKAYATANEKHGIDLISPTHSDNKWQAKQAEGFDLASFQIDWQNQQAICPANKTSISWSPTLDRYKTPVIRIKFSLLDCRACEYLSKCTKSKTKRRAISVRTEQAHLALQKARSRQNEPDFWQYYKKRAGIEGTLSQGIRSFGMRQSRYRTMAKTNLQHLLVASAINIVRVLAWLDGQAQAQTPKSNFAALAA